MENLKLEEMISPELTPEEKAFTAGYMAAEVNWYRMVRKGITEQDADEYNNDVAYDIYIDEMAKYFIDEKETSTGLEKDN